MKKIELIGEDDNTIDSIAISCEKEKEIKLEDVRFPTALTLVENEVYKIEIRLLEKMFEGVFIAITQSQRVQLYLQN